MPAPRFSALGLASRPSSGASFLLASCLCLASGLLVGCGEGTSGAETRAGEGAPAVPWGPELQALAKRVEAGDARGVLAALARRSLQDDGQDDPLQRVELEARARFLDGDSVGALRVLEGAKLDHMTDARLWALEAELFAAMGRGSAAEEALVRGQRLAGRTPELERANGILCLTRPGEVRNGLEALQRARQLHAELPFVDGPLAQAHLLNGRRRLADAPGEARAHARSGLALVPGQHELRELLAEAQEALGEFEEAIETLSALESEGVRFGERVALLHQRAATAALLGGRRDEALEHYASARERGLNDEGLGFGATALTDAAGDAVERGFAYLEAEEYPAAETAFLEALRFAPQSPDARYFLGAARFRQERYAEAALVWEALQRDADAAQLELPDPVHLDVARAWRMAGEREEALRVVDDYLRADPDGRWASETREMRTRLQD